MPYLETVGELAESLADALGIYNQKLCFVGMTVADSRALRASGYEFGYEGHADDCGCRQCWCSRMEQRITNAVANDVRVTQQETP